MKYLKMLGLAAIAAGALMAFVGAGTASATELTCTEPAGTKVMCPVGTIIHAESEGIVTLHPPIGDIECKSTIQGTTTNTGGASETVTGHLTTVDWTNCNADVTTLANGTLEIHTDPNDSVGTSGNGTLTSTGTEVTVEFVGFHCIFKTNATDIGTVTGATTNGGMATFDISATIPRTGGRSGAFCGSTAQWTGNYTITQAGSASGNNGWLDIDHHP